MQRAGSKKGRDVVPEGWNRDVTGQQEVATWPPGPGDLPDPGTESEFPVSPAFQADS